MCQQVTPIEFYVKHTHTKTTTSKTKTTTKQQQQQNLFAVNKQPYIHLCLYPY